jgi:alkylhydroperoxidase family enzyme
MRLTVADSDFAWPARLFVALVRKVRGQELPDVVKTQLYRPNLFGRWASPATHDIMRGPSPWTIGERELFAARVSRLLQCPF